MPNAHGKCRLVSSKLQRALAHMRRAKLGVTLRAGGSEGRRERGWADGSGRPPAMMAIPDLGPPYVASCVRWAVRRRRTGP